MLSRRTFLGALALAVSAHPALATGRPAMRVWKSPTCGCCAGWVDYIREHGIDVQVTELDDLSAVKSRLGVRPELGSCHTATIDRYVIEGHVPVADIRRLLAERPDILGLTAPGMPQFSPGMMSREPRGYDVLAFRRSGEVSVFSRY